MWETWVRSLRREDILEKRMATHSSTLAWRIPWTEDPGGLQSMGSQRVWHDWATNTFTSLSFSRLFPQGSSTLPANPVLPSWGFISILHPRLTFLSKAHTLDFLGVQWLRILLLMQRSRVPSLVWEDLTCHRATKSMHHNYWAYTPEPASCNYWPCVLQLSKHMCLETMLCNKRSYLIEKPAPHNEE